MKIISTILLMFTILLSFSQKKTTYVGKTGWNISTNWTNGIPTSKDTAIINANVSAINSTVALLTINNSVKLTIPSSITINAPIVNVNASASITISGILRVSKNLYLNSKSSVVLSQSSNLFANNIDYKSLNGSIRISKSSNLFISGSFLNYNYATLLTNIESNVYYNGNVTQYMMKSTYGNLYLSGTGTKYWNNSSTFFAYNTTTKVPNFSQSNNNTLVFGNTTTQTIPTIIGGTTTYGNVLLQNSNKTLGGNCTINNLTCNSILNLNNFKLSLTGDLFLNKSINGNNTSDNLSFVGSLVQTVSGPDVCNIKNLEINKTANTYPVSVYSQINIYSTLKLSNKSLLYPNSNITMKSTSTNNTANLLAIPVGCKIIGNIVTERYISATVRNWYHITPTVKNVNIAQLQDDFPVTGSFTGSNIISGSNNGLSIYKYKEFGTIEHTFNGGYSSFVSSTSTLLNSGIGYTAFIRTNSTITRGAFVLDMIGEPYQGNLSVNLTYTYTGGAGDGWNFVGNPYMCSIDWNSPAFTKSSDISIPYVWNGVTSSWDNPTIIPPGQGFFVRTASNKTLTFNENIKTNSQNNFRKDEYQRKTRITLSNKFDSTSIEFSDRDIYHLSRNLLFENHNLVDFGIYKDSTLYKSISMDNLKDTFDLIIDNNIYNDMCLSIDINDYDLDLKILELETNNVYDFKDLFCLDKNKYKLIVNSNNITSVQEEFKDNTKYNSIIIDMYGNVIENPSNGVFIELFENNEKKLIVK